MNDTQTVRGQREVEHTFRTEKTTAYGLHRATVRTPDGREVEALGMSERRAYLNALRMSNERDEL